MRPYADISDRQLFSEVSSWLEKFISPERLATDLMLDEFIAQSAISSVDYGPLKVLSFGPQSSGGLVAWGYPHPDEPLGATALLALAAALAKGHRLPGVMGNWPIRLVLCADPQGAAINRRWINGRPPSLAALAAAHSRPQGAGLEVDYSFPISFGEHRAPAAQMMSESLALAQLLSEQQPQLVGLMHNSLTGGDFTFLSHRPGHLLVESFDRLEATLGRSSSQLPGQPGQLLCQSRGDLIGERTLAERLDVSRNLYGALQPGEVLLGAASAAMFCQSLPSPPLVVTPEAALLECRLGEELPLTVGQLMSTELAHRGKIREQALRFTLTVGQRKRLNEGGNHDLQLQTSLSAATRQAPASRQWREEMTVAGRLGLLLELAGETNPQVTELRGRLLAELAGKAEFISGPQVTNACRSILGRLLLCAGAEQRSC